MGDKPLNARCCDSVLYYQLMMAGMSRWIPVIVGLLHQYEGVEASLGFEEEFPINALTRMTSDIQHWPAGERDKQMLDALTRLPVLFFRARRGIWRWCPLEMPWKEFIADRRTTESLVCWMCHEPDPSPIDLRDWALARLPAICV